MKTVGIAKLKAQLSWFLRHVQNGGEVLVTSHRHLVAKLVSAGQNHGIALIPPEKPVSGLRRIKGIRPLSTFDPVDKLIEDRARR